MKKIIGLFRLHVDLSTIVILVLIGNLIYKPIVGYIKLQASKIATQSGTKEILNNFGLNILSDIIAAGIISLIIIIVFKLKYKSSISGTFNASEIISKTVDKGDGNTETEDEVKLWGTVVLTHNIFTNDLRGQLTSTDGTVIILLNAKFERSEYIRGSYIETTHQIRRRIGAFLLRIDGSGKNFKGGNVFVDPEDSNENPKSGRIIWERK